VLLVLRDETAQFWARALSFGILIFSLLVIANLLILLAMRRDLFAYLMLNDRRANDRGIFLSRSDEWLVRILMGVILYFVSVLGFAYRIYPFIPAQKAGGDYTTVGAVTVRLSASSSMCSSSDLAKDFSTSGPLVVLSEDANWVYLAPVAGADSGGGPECWKWGAFCSAQLNNPGGKASGFRPPKVYTVSQRCIAAIEDAK
jgi:hypothetical protein